MESVVTIPKRKFKISNVFIGACFGAVFALFPALATQSLNVALVIVSICVLLYQFDKTRWLINWYLIGEALEKRGIVAFGGASTPAFMDNIASQYDTNSSSLITTNNSFFDRYWSSSEYPPGFDPTGREPTGVPSIIYRRFE